MAEKSNSSRRVFLGTAGALGVGMLAQRTASAQDVPLAPPDRQPPDLAVPEPPGKKVGWAIVGLGKLALEEVMPAFGECRLSEPTALVSGHRDKAEKVAAAYGLQPQNIYSYENYDELKGNSEVEVIYIILPNSMHAEYTIRGLQAGKHVLCEKPMSVTVDEAVQMVATAKTAQRKLMIAYRLRYEPFNKKAIEICEQGELGALQSISASNCQVVEAPNIRLSKQLGGGPLGDVGVYCLNAARYLTREEPIEVTAMMHQPRNDPRFREVPATVAWTMRFPSGVIANCDCSFNAGESRRYRVHGTKGYLELDPAYSYEGLELRQLVESQHSEFQLPAVNHFAAEMDHLPECVLQNKSPLTTGEDGLADMRVMAAIEQAAATGQVVRSRLSEMKST
jgi:predicted dehydrogenase